MIFLLFLSLVLVLPLSTSTGANSCQDRAAVGSDKCEKTMGKMVFEVSPEQRNFLLQSNSDSYDEINDWLSQIKKSYDMFGLVLIQGLLDDNTISRLGQAGDILDQQTSSSSKQFSTVKFGPIFLSPPPAAPSSACISDAQHNQPITVATDREDSDVMGVFREVALQSAIPKFIAKVLLHLNESDGSTLRVLNDVFFAKGKEQGFCGWHVDDLHFWPTSAVGTIGSSGIGGGGVNAWIAIDDIPSSQGGGLAVVPKSHISEWRYDAYNIIGSVPVHPEEGFSSAQDLFSTFPATTCDLASVSPELSSLMDNEAVIINFTKGDVLLMNRWLWHKSIPASLEQHNKNNPLKRYTIRYDTGSTRLQKGYSTQLSIMYDAENSGKSLDDISQRSGPFFPRAFPDADPTELSQLSDLIENKFPVAEAQRRIQMDEARKYFLARGQYYRS